MELRRAFSISLDKHLWIKDKTNSMKTASHGSVIGPSHANPNCSSDNLNSSMKMRLLRYAKGTIKRLPSTVFTNKWPLSATDLESLRANHSFVSVGNYKEMLVIKVDDVVLWGECDEDGYI